MSWRFADIEPLLASIAESGLILVGGQALNYWARQFSGELPLPGLTSKDLDLFGSVADAERAAAILGVSARHSTVEMDTVNAAAFDANVGGGAHISVQVLISVLGLDSKDVTEMSIPVDLPGGGSFRVLHPVLVMQSRIINVNALHRHDEHSLLQAKASVPIAGRFIELLAGQEATRPALLLCERIFEFALRHLHAKAVYRDHAIDPFDAVQPLPSLPKEFREIRYPQMQATLEGSRSSG